MLAATQSPKTPEAVEGEDPALASQSKSVAALLQRDTQVVVRLRIPRRQLDSAPVRRHALCDAARRLERRAQVAPAQLRCCFRFSANLYCPVRRGRAGAPARAPCGRRRGAGAAVAAAIPQMDYEFIIADLDVPALGTPNSAPTVQALQAATTAVLGQAADGYAQLRSQLPE